MSYTWGRRCAMRPTGSPEELERRGLRALELLKQGLLPSEVARRVDVDRRSVRRWKSAARQAGAAALRAKPASGRPLKLVERRFGVSYHVDSIGRLLHQLGWSAQKPARRALERDERQIRRWVRQEWPRVKKTPPASARRSSLSTKPGS